MPHATRAFGSAIVPTKRPMCVWLGRRHPHATTPIFDIISTLCKKYLHITLLVVLLYILLLTLLKRIR